MEVSEDVKKYKVLISSLEWGTVVAVISCIDLIKECVVRVECAGANQVVAHLYITGVITITITIIMTITITMTIDLVK